MQSSDCYVKAWRWKFHRSHDLGVQFGLNEAAESKRKRRQSTTIVVVASAKPVNLWPGVRAWSVLHVCWGSMDGRQPPCMPSTYIPIARFPAAHVDSHMPARGRKTKTGEVDRRVCDHLHISGMGERTSSWLVAAWLVAGGWCPNSDSSCDYFRHRGQKALPRVFFSFFLRIFFVYWNRLLLLSVHQNSAEMGTRCLASKEA
jgi:hypothetical protein